MTTWRWISPPRVSHQHEGLYGFVTHPTKPYLYVTVDRDLDPATAGPNKNRSDIVRFTSSDGGRTYDPASEALILRVDRPGVLHPPSTLVFGPDGFLYISVGEVGLPYTTNAIFGSILRIDVAGGTPYAIPTDSMRTARCAIATGASRFAGRPPLRAPDVGDQELHAVGVGCPFPIRPS